MNNNKRTMITLVIVGGLTILITLLIFFLLGLGSSTINNLALMFVIISEVVFFGGTTYLCANDKFKGSLFTKSGVISALFIYLIMSMILGLASGVFGDNVGAFILVGVILNALLIGAIAIFWLFSHRINTSDEETARKLANGEYDKPKRGGF